MSGLIRGLGALLLFGLAACSFTQVAYERADWLLMREIGRYLPLRAEQRESLREALRELHAWHRASELPAYAEALRALHAELSEPLSPPQVLAWFERTEQRLWPTLERSLPEAARLIPQLEDAQIERFWQRFDERRAERRAKRGTARDRERAALRSFRRWVGPPTEQQRQLIRDWAERAPALDSPEREAYLAERRAALAALLAARGQPDFEDRFIAFFTVPEPLPPALETQRLAGREQAAELLAALSATLTAGQRQRLRAQLLRYAEDFEALSAEAPPLQPDET